jgi:diguanylate cyclase (GGDEF)-like protein
MEKLIEQFDFDWSEKSGTPRPAAAVAAASGMSEERATILFLLDTYNKHLIEFEGHPVRKERETLDAFAKELVNPKDQADLERVLFRFRQFFSAYRVDECAYFHKTFEDFRTIIWDFVDQLSEDIGQEQKEDAEIRHSLDELKEAVESNSIDALKNQSRKFIDCYVEKQFKKDKRRNTRMKSIRQNLNLVKKQLGDANNSMRVDHLTQAYNRKTFDEYVEQHWKLFQASAQPISLLLIDIDHFKNINDTYGHAIGDFVLKELVNTLKSLFTRESDLVARIGGEEFAVLLPDYKVDAAMTKAEEILNRVRHEAYAHEGKEIRFHVSIGVASLCPGEAATAWIKRADLALYHSKNTGRDRATLAPTPLSRAA